MYHSFFLVLPLNKKQECEEITLSAKVFVNFDFLVPFLHTEYCSKEIYLCYFCEGIKVMTDE